MWRCIYVSECLLDQRCGCWLPGPAIVFVNDAFERLDWLQPKRRPWEAPRGSCRVRGPCASNLTASATRSNRKCPCGDPAHHCRGGSVLARAGDCAGPGLHVIEDDPLGGDRPGHHERKATEEEVEHLAFYDADLVPQPAAADGCLRQTLTRRQHHDRIGALMLIRDDFNSSTTPRAT